MTTTTKTKPNESEKKKKTPSTRSETVSDVREEMEKERSAAGDGVECPVCGQKEIKSLRHHVNYRAAAGDVAHAEYKAAQRRGIQAGPVGGPYFAPGAGKYVVKGLLSFILQARPTLRIPEGWVEEAGEAHQIVLEKHLGPRLKEKSDLAYLGLIWFELFAVNVAAPALEEAGAEPSAGPLEVPLKPAAAPAEDSPPSGPTA